MENTENWVEKYKERMDKNKPSEKLVEQTLELMKHQIELQRKDKKKMLKNRNIIYSIDSCVCFFCCRAALQRKLDKNGIVTMKIANGPILCLWM